MLSSAGLRRLDELLVGELKRDAAGEPDEAGHINDADRDDRLPKPGGVHREDEQTEQDRRERHQDVHAAHDRLVDGAAL